MPLRKLNFSFHKTLYLDLHREFTKSEYAPQSEASWQNFKTLLMLEIAILLGCDLEWATGSSVGAAAVADPPVLAAGESADDDDASNSEDGDAPGCANRAAAARAPAPADPNASDDTNDASASGPGHPQRAISPGYRVAAAGPFPMPMRGPVGRRPSSHSYHRGRRRLRWFCRTG